MSCGCGCGGAGSGPGGENSEFSETVEFGAAAAPEDETGLNEFYNEFKSRKAMFWVAIITLFVGIISLFRG